MDVVFRGKGGETNGEQVESRLAVLEPIPSTNRLPPRAITSLLPQDPPGEGPRFERLLLDLSSRFMDGRVEEIESKIEWALQRIVEFLDIDRASFVTLPGGDRNTLLIDYYARPEFDRISSSNMAEKFPWIVEKLSHGKTVRYNRIEELPGEAARDKQMLQELKAKSLLALPFRIRGKPVGGLSCVSLREEKIWPEGLISRLKLAGEMIAGAFYRQQLEEKCEEALGEIGRLRDQARNECIPLPQQMEVKGKFKQIIGQSDAIKYVFFRVEQVASTDSAVLILGETGTGKGLIARAIHSLSRRRERPLVNVDCAALPPNLIESELFGREKGAFTGSSSRQIGRFELAHGGTIVLDEVGELPLELQAKLLRAIQDGEFERLGSPRTLKVDVRIIASTRRDLKEEVRKGRFREDLFYRLHVFPITIPPLRQRTEDIPLLVNHFVQKFARKIGKEIKTIPKPTLARLQAHSWPGNVRELEHVIERAVIITEGSTLHLADHMESPGPARSAEQDIETLDEVQRKHILRALEKTGDRIEGKQGAASLLGINPSTLRGRMRKLGITGAHES